MRQGQRQEYQVDFEDMLNEGAIERLMKYHLSKSSHLDANCRVASGVPPTWTLIWKGGDNATKALSEV